VVELRLGELRVHRHRDGAGPARGEAEEQHLVAVGRGDDHPVAGLHPVGDAPGPPAHPLRALGVGEGEAAVGLLDQPPVTVVVGEPLQQVAEGEVPPEGEAHTTERQVHPRSV
jgi:hypothetical protein